MSSTSIRRCDKSHLAVSQSIKRLWCCGRPHCDEEIAPATLEVSKTRLDMKHKRHLKWNVWIGLVDDGLFKRMTTSGIYTSAANLRQGNKDQHGDNVPGGETGLMFF